MSENIGLITLVCSWTFTAIATLVVGLTILVIKIRNVSFRLDDYVQIAAYFITVGQTTWAIVDESQDKHVTEITHSQLALVAKASFRYYNSEYLLSCSLVTFRE